MRVEGTLKYPRCWCMHVGAAVADRQVQRIAVIIEQDMVAGTGGFVGPVWFTHGLLVHFGSPVGSLADLGVEMCCLQMHGLAIVCCLLVTGSKWVSAG